MSEEMWVIWLPELKRWFYRYDKKGGVMGAYALASAKFYTSVHALEKDILKIAGHGMRYEFKSVGVLAA